MIRNEQVIPFGPLDNGATGKQRTLMAEGNLLLFTDLAPQINNFIKTFGDHETFDQAAIDAFKADFPEDQQGLARGFEAYYQARFTDDPKAKQELTLLGNYNLVTHEQALVDPILDEVLTDLPWYADAGNFFTGNEGSERANEAIVVEYPGRSSSVADDVPAHDPDQAAFDNLVVDYDGIDDGRIQEFLLRYADDNNANPSNLENTDAKDWHEYSERMYYIYQDWRVHHTDQGIFDMAAESGLSDVNFGSSDS